MSKPEEGKIEIVEPSIVAAEKPPTEAEAIEHGLSPDEIASAKEHGLLAKDEDTGKKEKSDDDIADAGDKGDDAGDGEGADAEHADETDDEKGDGENGKKEEEKETVRDVLDQELDPEKEQETVSKFNSNEKALYWRLKKEKVKRQSIESEKDHVLIKLKAQEKENDALRAQLEVMKSSKRDVEEDIDIEKPDENGKKYLTEADIEAREKEKEEKEKKRQESLRERAQVLANAHKDLELDGKSRYTDFDEVETLASEIVSAAASGRLDELFPDPRVRTKINRQVNELLYGLQRADEYKSGEYNPADMAYELGKSHPKHGKPSSTTNGKSGKDQGLSPEEVDKLARRRIPSAAIPGGGGRRVVSYDDLALEDLAKLSDEQFRKVPKNIRDRVLNAS